MNTQPEALRLADELEVTNGLFMKNEAALELRRLHEDNARIKTLNDDFYSQCVSYIQRITQLEATNQTLLNALKEIVSQIDQGGSGGKVFSRDACIAQARAAIAKATRGQA